MIALNLDTWQIVKYSYKEDGYLYVRLRNGREKLLGPESKFITGIANINKIIRY